MRIRSPSSTRAIVPPEAASGETWPIDRPDVPPEKRPSVTSAHDLAQSAALEERRRIEHLLHARSALRPFVADHHDVARLTRACARIVSTASSCDSHDDGRAREGPDRLVDARGLHHAAVDGEVAAAAPRDRRRASTRAPRRGCSRRPRRCPGSPSARTARTPSPTRSQPGAACEQLDGLGRRRAAPDVPVLSATRRSRRCARCGRRRSAARRGTTRPGSPGCRRRGARPPCSSAAPFGATLRRHGTRREIASMSSRSKSSSASCAAASRCSTVFVEPPIATSSAIAFSNAARDGDGPRQHGVVVVLVVPLARSRRPCGRRSRTARLRAVWVASTEPLPGRARPSASARQFIEFAVNMPEHEPHVGQASSSMRSDVLVGDVRRRRRSVIASIRFSPVRTRAVDQGRPAALHRAAGDEHGRDVQPQRGHQHAGGDLVAVGDADQRVGAVRLDHVLDRVGDQVARRQRVEHPAVAHRDAVVDGDRVELAGDPAGRVDRLGHDPADRLQVGVAGDELGEAVGHRDDRLAEVLSGDAGGHAAARARLPCCGRG